MLKLGPFHGLAPALGILLLAGCDQAPPPPIELGEHTEATYRLLFNDELVGHALFVLDVDRHGNYRLETLTTPAGDRAGQAAHEILETSLGIADRAIRPLRFEHSLLRDGDIDLLSLTFDWDQRRAHLQHRDRRQTFGLQPDTHDRLSYLMAAQRLAETGTGSLPLQIISTEASEQTLLIATGREDIEVPLGRYDAVVIDRRSAQQAQRRTLWFDTSLSPLPLRVRRASADEVVDMQLEHLQRRDQSASE